MSKVRFYGKGLANVTITEVRGKLIVLEGPDGVGRSTQIALLREWLEANGYAVFSSGLRRSELASVWSPRPGATGGLARRRSFTRPDLAARLEREILRRCAPAFIVLRTVNLYSLIACVGGCGAVRSPLDRFAGWGFPLVPDAIFTCAVMSASVPRCGWPTCAFDYWSRAWISWAGRIT